VKFFVDTANSDELRTGEQRIRMICNIVDGDIRADVVETDAGLIIKPEREMAKIHKNVA
jgi:hypothetical protein